MRWINQISLLASNDDILTGKKVNLDSELQKSINGITCSRLRRMLSQMAQDALTQYLTVVAVNPESTYKKSFMKLVESRKNALHGMGIEIELSYQSNTKARIVASRDRKMQLRQTSRRSK